MHDNPLLPNFINIGYQIVLHQINQKNPVLKFLI